MSVNAALEVVRPRAASGVSAFFPASGNAPVPGTSLSRARLRPAGAGRDAAFSVVFPSPGFSPAGGTETR